MGAAEIQRADPPGATGSRASFWTDGIITAVAAMGAVYLVVAGRCVPGWWGGALELAFIATGPLLFRALRRLFRSPWLDLARIGWILPAAMMGHGALRPLVDAAHPRLFDRLLVEADLRIFGTEPALALSHALRGPLLDLLMGCYYTFFLWPVMLAALLYVGRRHAALETYRLALTVCFALNFAGYLLLPAIGPRYYLATALGGPLPGTAVTAMLESAMRWPDFNRDCFPSGHTAVTLLVMLFAWRHCRRFFWVMAPFGLGLIVATLAGRFHYAIDLIAAVPLAVASVAVATALARARASPARSAVPVRAPNAT